MISLSDVLQARKKVIDLENDLIKHIIESPLTDVIAYWYQNTHNKDVINHYFSYLKNLFELNILHDKDELGNPYLVARLNFDKDKILYRLNSCYFLDYNQKRYRLNALIAFTRFLSEETKGQVNAFFIPKRSLLSCPPSKIDPPEPRDPHGKNSH